MRGNYRHQQHPQLELRDTSDQIATYVHGFGRGGRRLNEVTATITTISVLSRA